LTKPAPKNLPASVRQKLANLARKRNVDFGLILVKYGLERILLRLSRSPYRDIFILKGALLVGYLRSLQDLETVPVATKDGTPVLIRDLGTVAFGPDIRQGVVEWNGEGETVGGIIVMRDGMNALKVIEGVKKKLAEIKPSLPSGVAIVSGYDRSGLIQASIETLQRDLLEEAIIVSFVTIAFLFHFRSALIPILTLPIAVLASFIPMYFLPSVPTSCRLAA
jgi:Cu/Ag efflux pump CusA